MYNTKIVNSSPLTKMEGCVNCKKRMEKQSNNIMTNTTLGITTDNQDYYSKQASKPHRKVEN